MREMLRRRIVSLVDDDEPLEPADVPQPRPGAGEVLVRISACGVCHTERPRASVDVAGDQIGGEHHRAGHRGVPAAAPLLLVRYWLVRRPSKAVESALRHGFPDSINLTHRDMTI